MLQPGISHPNDVKTVSNMFSELLTLFNRNWFTMPLISSGVASLIHLLAMVIATIRIGRWSAIVFCIVFPLYTFISAFFYTILLSFSVILTYSVSKNTLTDQDVFYWGLGLGVLYVILKAVISGILK